MASSPTPLPGFSSPPAPPTSPPPVSPPPAPPTSPPPGSPTPPVSSSPPPSSPPPSSPPPTPILVSPPPTPILASPPPAPILSPPPSSDVSPSPPPPDSSFSPPVPPTPPSPTPSSVVQPPPTTSFNASPPPPPAHSTKEPSKHKPSGSKSTPSSSQSDKNSTDTQLPIIIGVVVGVGLFFIILGSVFLFCCIVKKKKRSQNHMQYYADPPGKGNNYYMNNSNWHNAAQPEHIIKIPPPPGARWPSPSPPAWASPPPPPPPMLTSSDMSSNFSDPNQPQPPPSPGCLGLGFNKSSFTYDELSAATNGFSHANLLGEGGFGYVYKGVFPNGKDVAVKQLKVGSRQGEREFQAEVDIISRVHHRYLVSLIGYCIADGQRMLVYEFVPNNTLEHHLHGNGLPTMDWPTRLKIALGSAKGLAYIHEDCHPRIIHRDIKAANILLDYNFDAKVADFGLAKLSEDNNTHISTRVMGTFGYLAPEYASSGKLTDKSDVFSFGVMLLELISGRRPVDPKHIDDCLVDWGRPLLTQALEDGDYSRLVDPRLEDNYDRNEMGRMVACAATSIRHSSKRRPKMSQIVRALEGDLSLEDLNKGVKPGHSSMFSSSESSEYDVGSYNADMIKFRKMALGTQTMGRALNAPTSEYGLNPSSSSSEDEGSPETDSTPDRRHG